MERARTAARRIRCSPGWRPGTHAYFVHSYHFRPADPRRSRSPLPITAAPLAAVVGRDNLVGTQFHPEKSQEAGLRLIANFLRWRP